MERILYITRAAICSLITVVVLMAGSAAASDSGAVDCIASSVDVPSSELPRCDDLYPPQLFEQDEGPWRFGFGAGYGKRSNPLINSDDVPVYGVVQLSYFGDRFFFDNGDVGWLLMNEARYSVNLIAGVGGERSFYSFLNESPVAFLETPTGSDFSPAPETPGVIPEDYEPEAPDRDFVIDGGVELLYRGPQLEWQMQVLTDISDKHNGQEVWVSASYPMQFRRWQIVPTVGATWLSADAANYYYGVREDEAAPLLPAYQVNDALNPFARLSVSYSINEHWYVIATGQYERLADEIRDSSSVADGQVSTFFTGLYYEF